MARSFGLVDGKVVEADFFLGKIPECGYNFFALRCYISAFASSARSITFALQSVLTGTDRFDKWYQDRQARLRKDTLARFFHEFRTVSQHIGENPVGAGSSGPGQKTRYYFTPRPDLPNVPEQDVESCCRLYFHTLVDLVFDCYIEFGPVIDAHQYFTAENFERLGKTIEDAEEELGFPRGWTDIGDPESIAYRWQALQDTTTGCQINHLFERYLGKAVPAAERLPPYTPAVRV
jgi:hypothetical protein